MPQCTGTGTEADPLRVALAKRPGGRRGGRRPFDVGGCDNVELLPLILQGALAAGWPHTQSLYLWACVSRDVHQQVRDLIAPLLQEMRTKTEVWREAATALAYKNRTADEVAMCKADLVISISKLVAGPITGRLLSMQEQMYNVGGFFRGPHSDMPNWVDFEYDWAFMAHLCQELCMACSGHNIRHVHRMHTDCALAAPRMAPPSSVRLDGGIKRDGFCFPCGQHVVPEQGEGSPAVGFYSRHMATCLYAKPHCIEAQSFVPWPLGPPRGYGLTRSAHVGKTPTSPFAAHEQKMRGGGSAARHNNGWTGMLAKAMLNMKDIYDYSSHSVANLFVQDSDNESTRRLIGTQALFLEPHRYIPASATLAGRLQLTAAELAAAKAQATRSITMRRAEEEALREARVTKHFADVSAYLERKLPGESLASLCQNFPTFKRSIQCMLRNAEKRMHMTQCGPRFALKYRDALEDHEVRSMCDRLVTGVREVGRRDQFVMGADRGHSAEAYEWLLNLTVGSVDPNHPGEAPDELWRVYLDRGSTFETGCHDDMAVAALHLFDELSSSKWTLDVVEGPSGPPDMMQLHWKLQHRTSGVELGGRIPNRPYTSLKKWHEAVSRCFTNCQSTCGLQLPRTPPSQRTYERGTDFTERKNKRETVCIEETKRYFVEMAAVCVLFPETRHAGLLLLGIVPTQLIGELNAFYHKWYDGVVQPELEVPLFGHGFTLWFCGDPRGTGYLTLS